MKLNSLHNQIHQQSYSKSYLLSRRQQPLLYYRVTDIEKQVWPIIREIIVDRETVLLYTTHTQNQQRGNTND